MAQALGADVEHGLTASEAARRLAQDGPNELRAVPRRPAWRRALAHLHDPLVYLLLVAAAVALVAWAIEEASGWPMDAIVIVAVVIQRRARLVAGNEGRKRRGRTGAHDSGELGRDPRRPPDARPER